MQIPTWAVKVSTSVIMLMLAMNGWFVNRLVQNIDEVSVQVQKLTTQVAVLEFAIKNRKE